MNVVDFVVLFGLSAIVTTAAAVGQIGMARDWAKVPEPWHLSAPFVFELAMGGFLWLGYRQGRQNLSPALMWTVAAAVGALSVFVQFAHSGTFGSGLFFAAASTVALLMMFSKAYNSYRAYLRSQDKVIKPIPKFGRDWLFAMPTAWRGMLISSKVDSEDPSRILRLATTWRITFKTARLYKVPRSLAKILAWNEIFRALGLPMIVIPEELQIPDIDVRRRQMLRQPVIDAEVVEERKSIVNPVEETLEPDVPAGDPDPQEPYILPEPVVAEPEPVPAPPPPPSRPAANSERSKGDAAGDPFEIYFDQLYGISTHLPGWKTQSKKISAGDVLRAQKAAQAAGTLERVITAKAYLLKFAWMLEALSDRADSIPANHWEAPAGALADVSREKLDGHRESLRP